MKKIDSKQAHDETRDAWNVNAKFWDERMGEGNDFVNVLQMPAIARLLPIKAGERVLDIGCGNGLMSRRLAAQGAEVVAFDFAAEMIAHARERTREYKDRITYLVLDATDESALLKLGEGSFDAALSNMALFDMAEIKPLFRALARLLKPDGRFVFTMMHPCFNNPYAIRAAELEDRAGDFVTTYSINVKKYMTSSLAHGAAIAGQPKPQIYFHRPLQELFGVGFETGFVIDGFEERAFPPDHPSSRNPLFWSGDFSEFPPVLVVRMRKA